MGDFADYEDMKLLLNGREWKVYMDFLRKRSVRLNKKILQYIRQGDLIEAQKTTAIYDDKLKEIDLFKKKKVDLENEIDAKEEK